MQGVVLGFAGSWLGIVGRMIPMGSWAADVGFGFGCGLGFGLSCY